MQPAQILDLLIKDANLVITKPVRKAVLEDKYFRKLTENFSENHMNMRLVIDLIAAAKAHMGSCPRCGGFATWRRGVHFEHEKHCWKCDRSFEPGVRIPEEEIEPELRKTEPSSNF